MSGLADALDGSGSAASSSASSSSSSRISLSVPPSLLVLPPAAALAGALIGMSRGGTRAKLRFLAENAHRQPKTVQGWYFYTKTRNYRVFFGAIRSGARYALGFGAAGAAYVCVDEGVGWARELVFHPELHTGARGAAGETRGWRRGAVHWEDGAVAGGLLAGLGGVAYGLPNPLLFRALVLGTALGSVDSLLQIARAKVGDLRAAHEAGAAAGAAAAAADARGEHGASAAPPAGVGAIAEVEEAAAAPGLKPDAVPVDTEAAAAPGGAARSWWAWLRGR